MSSVKFRLYMYNKRIKILIDNITRLFSNIFKKKKNAAISTQIFDRN